MTMEEETIRAIGRVIVGGYYDHQEVRQANMNRIRDVVRKKNEGIPLDAVEDKKDKKKFAKKYQDANLPKLLTKMKDEGKLTEKELDYIQKSLNISKGAERFETEAKALMKGYIESHPIYWDFLKKIRGIGPVLSSNIIKSFGYCERFDMVSALWKYCGLHVVDGKAPKRAKGEKIDWNPKLRTMCWKIADSFIKGNSPVYRQIYDSEKEKQFSLRFPKGELRKRYNSRGKDGPYKEDDLQLSKGHVDNRARRKMVKIFLQHYWVVSREMAGLDTRPPYPIDKLGHRSYISPEEVILANAKA